jgi:hypothetical protein
MNQRLLAYLNSRGTVIPEDYADYTAYGSYHHQCIFCQSPHLKAGVIKGKGHLTPIDVRATAFCCETCQFEIDATFDIPVSFMTDPRDSEEIAIAHDAITTYIEEGLFPPDVHDFCLGGNKSECCVFCGKGFSHKHSGSFLTVPQGPDQTKYITGSLQICAFCADDYMYLVQRYGEENLHDDSVKSISHDRCTLCKEMYPITIDEYEYRKKNGLLESCYCNQCLEIHWGKERLQITECASCKTQLIVDLVTSLTYREWTPIYCSICKVNQKLMIEIPIPNPYDEDDSVKLVITDVQCQGEIRWHCVVVYQQPEYMKTTIDSLSTNYHNCSKGRDPCGCFGSPSEAAYTKTLEVLAYYDERALTPKR